MKTPKITIKEHRDSVGSILDEIEARIKEIKTKYARVALMHVGHIIGDIRCELGIPNENETMEHEPANAPTETHPTGPHQGAKEAEANE